MAQHSLPQSPIHQDGCFKTAAENLLLRGMILRAIGVRLNQPLQTNPDSLDALTAAASHHRLLLENEHVRVLETLIPPGEKTAVHTHCWPSVQYCRSWSDFIRRDQQGNIMLDSRTITPPALGSALWSEPYPPHSVENIGTADIHFLVVEIKPAP